MARPDQQSSLDDLLKEHDDDIVDSGSIICWMLARSVADYERLYDQLRPSEVYHLLSVHLALHAWQQRSITSSLQSRSA